MRLIIRLESSLFRGRRKLHAYNLPYNYLTYSSFHYFGLGHLGLVLISRFRVLSTLTISSFVLEAREEYTAHENPRFLQKRRT